MGMTNDPIKVLIVDDALFMRKAISEILESDPTIKVVGTAQDGLEGLEKIRTLKPDVVTLDIDMPRMDGLAALRHIMIESPVPVVVLSSLFSNGEVTFEALRLGVVDFVPKPSGSISDDMGKSRQQISNRIKIASDLNLHNIRRVKLKKFVSNRNIAACENAMPPQYLIALGTSLSGPNTVIRLLTRLPNSLPASIVVVQEIAPQILPAFVDKFREYVPWEIKAGEDGTVIEQGTCYVCSNKCSIKIGNNEERKNIILQGSEVRNPLDILFESAAEVFQQNSIGVLLTGIGDDGAEGLQQILINKGVTIAQDIKCCVYPNLTQHAIEKGSIARIVSETELPTAIASAMA